MAKLSFRPEARADLREIVRYIAQDNVAAARAVRDRLAKRCQTLAVYPYMGTERAEIEPGLYGFPVGNYMIFYMIVDDGIEVVRVLHGARDIPRLF